ncbi:MAG TPA: glycosyltransferase 87 family protein [Gaiellales bacterium]
MVVVVVAVLAAAGTAHAAAHLTRRAAIVIAERQPQAQTLRLNNPGSHWEAQYDARAHDWVVLLEPPGAHNVLASFTIDDRTQVVKKVVVTPTLGAPRLNSVQAFVIASRQARVRSWIKQYSNVSHSSTLGDHRIWTVDYYAKGNEVAEVHIADYTEKAYEVWTGPQVAWQLARGQPQAYGRKANAAYVLWPLCALFLAGLMDWRRPISMRTLDLVMVLSFVASLEFFNKGDVFWSTPLIYPPMLYLIGRMVWIGWRRTPRPIHIGDRHLLVLVGLLFALMGFRLGLNNQDSNVIDVGYAGVAGAATLMDGVLPYGHMPKATSKPCDGRYFNGDPIGYIQSNGRCESPIASGDTYGPTVYLAYVPAVEAMGWSGKWDRLPAAHVAASAFDILAVVGLFVAGWRLGSRRVGVALAFAWAADPFTLYSLNMNSNDALVGALVAWTLAVLSFPKARGVLLAAAGLTKFAPLAMVPLFASLRNRFATLVGFGVAALLLLSMLALDRDGVSLFWHHTLDYQLGRVTPMSIWTLGDYHPGWYDLRPLQHVIQVVAVVGVFALAVFPRHRKDAAAVAAFAGAVVLAAQVAASYWFYPYVCWWLPAVMIALLIPRGSTTPA